LVRRLDYLHGLGVTAIWLMPFQFSPHRDDGYDVSALCAAKSNNNGEALTVLLTSGESTNATPASRAAVPRRCGNATWRYRALGLCLVSSAEARKWRWWYYGHGYSSRSSDDDGRSARAAEWTETARVSRGGGPFGAVIDRLVRGCLQQADEFRRWPFDDIARIAAPDEAQRVALEALRGSAAAAAERLTADCPQDRPAPPWARLEVVTQAIDATISAFAAVEPTLQRFYVALDDEQKARLLRDPTLNGAEARDADRTAERRERRTRRRGDAPPDRAAGNDWAGICERLTAALRGWPVREIERGVGLSEPQRVTFYEFVTSSLRAADALVGACPAETALTPPGRMKVLQARLSAVRAATAAIQPALTRFYEALDQGQKVRFAGMR
jgi:hypothetical protein